MVAFIWVLERADPKRECPVPERSFLESKITDDFHVSLTNAPGKESYPIVSFTWFYVPVHTQDLQRSHAVNEYLSWLYGSCQEIAQAQGYPPLSPSVPQKVRAKVAALH